MDAKAVPRQETGSPRLYNDLKSGEFRVTRVVRHNADQPELACELRTVHTGEDGLVYKALSYCWGDHEASSQILLNGQYFAVRPNLFDFLSEIGGEETDDWWFIDAVCIDQQDMAERAVQVGLMGEIYKNAEEVCVWLSNLRRRTNRQDGVSLVSLEEEYNAMASFEREDARRHGFKGQSMARARQAILENGYWLRLWVVQEVMLAKRLVIRWHRFLFDEEDIDFPLSTLDESIVTSKDGDTGTIMAMTPWLAAILTSMGPTEEEKALATCLSIMKGRKSWGPLLRAGRMLPLH